MSDYLSRIACFETATIHPEEVTGKRIVSTVDLDGEKFRLIFSYSHDVPEMDRNVAGLISLFPIVNFGLFTRRIRAEFPMEKADLQFLTKMLAINNTEVFVNKICRRRYEFYRREYLPEESEITQPNAIGSNILEAEGEASFPRKYTGKRTGVLLSGGKESLTTFGILTEAGEDPDAFFYNESGSHWFPAVPSYRHLDGSGHAFKVWTNTDRFYRWVLRRMKVLDQVAVARVADTYPVQLFIFPVYLMALLPLMIERKIGAVYMGNEFDDTREMVPYRGIRHYYGIYDQTAEFEREFNAYLGHKGIGIRLMSGVYPISASKVEEILVRRYPDLFRLQRSCHSSRIVHGKVIPCGRCSKCIGVISLILAAGGNPEEINYTHEAVENAAKSLLSDRIRLDRDEVAYLLSVLQNRPVGSARHIEGVHIIPGEKLPFERIDPPVREKIIAIVNEYAKGKYELRGDQWVNVQKNSA